MTTVDLFAGMTRMCRHVRWSSLAIALCVSLGPSGASAFEAEVDGTLSAQAYESRGPVGTPVLSRRRVIHTLGLSGQGYFSDLAPQGPEILVRVRLRVDADFGLARDEWIFGRSVPNLTRLVPGLMPSPIDVMVAYLEVRRLAKGLLTVRLGRQILVDPLGYYSFDGANLRLQTPWHVGFEAVGGMEVRAGLPLSAAGPWELPGVFRASREGLPDTGYPSVQRPAVAPVVGFGGELTGLTWLSLKATYRKVWNTGVAYTAGDMLGGPDVLGTYEKTRTSSERFGIAANAQPLAFLDVRGAWVHDFVYARTASAEAAVEVEVSPATTIAAEYNYFRPVFDADSIFSVFGFEPMDDGSVRMRHTFSPGADISLEGRIRRYRSEQPVETPGRLGELRVGSTVAEGGSLRGRFRLGQSRFSFRGNGLVGNRGHRVGLDATWERPVGQRLTVQAGVNGYHFVDELRATTAEGVLSLGYTVGAATHLTPESDLHLTLDHDINRVVGQRFRLMAALTVKLGL